MNDSTNAETPIVKNAAPQPLPPALGEERASSQPSPKIDTTDSHAAMGQLSHIGETTEQKQMTHSEVIPFDTGHMEWLQDFPDLLTQMKTYESNGIKLQGLLPEDIVTYLLEHKGDNPHAIATLFEILGNELRQKMPLKMLRGQKEDELSIAQAKTGDDDAKEIAQVEESAAREKPHLLKCVAEVSTELIAVDRLLHDKRIQQLITEYMDTYKNAERLYEGALTGDTYAQFLDEWQNIVIKRRDELTREMEDSEMQAFLQEGQQGQ